MDSIPPSLLATWNEMAPVDFEKLRQCRLTRGQLGKILLSSARYLFETEVHAYAFSIAANALLSFFPFSLILLAICRRWLHWQSAYHTILQLLRVNLPYGSADFVIRNLEAVVQGRPRLQLISVLTLFFTSSGVFLPLEIALNKVWGFGRNRTFLKNQEVSFILALSSGVLALSFILAVTPLKVAITFLLGWIPLPHLLAMLANSILAIASVPLIASVYFIIYYFLPNGKVPIERVIPAAIAMGVLTELGRGVYSWTLPLFRFREVYGPFEVSVTLLFWAYVGSLILLFGAHLSANMFVDRAPEVPPEVSLVGIAEHADNLQA
jgi:YihY family inner membrane protein